MNWARSIIPALALALVVGTVWAQSDGKDQKGGSFQFKVAVRAVDLSVVVTDRDRRFVPGLEADDFEIFENKVPQKMSFFTSEITPLTVLLLLDSSGSIRPSVEGIKEAAANFVSKLWDGDRAIIADFNQHIRFSTHFSEDKDRLINSIQSLYPSGGTALYDSILISLDKVSEVRGRKALLVFTDGDDSRAYGGSELSRGDAIEGSKFYEVSIYSIGFQGRRGMGGSGVNKGFLKEIAKETGGAAFFPKGIGELNESFTQIQEELHSQYRIAYVPTNGELNGSWREIEVRIKDRDDLVIRTRQGYYAIPSAD